MPKRNTAGANTLEKYTGHELDEEGNLNLFYAGARYLDPAMGRWNGVDPLLNEAATADLITDGYLSRTPYGYVSNNPLNIIDPDGKRECPPDCGLLDRIQSYLTGVYTGEHEFDQVAYTEEVTKGGAKELVDGGIGATEVLSDATSDAAVPVTFVNPGAGETLAAVSFGLDVVNFGLREFSADHLGGSQDAPVQKLEEVGVNIGLQLTGRAAARSLIKKAPEGVKNVTHVSARNNPLTGFKGRFVKNQAANNIYGAAGVGVALVQTLLGY